MRIPAERELQQITINHSCHIYFKSYSFLVSARKETEIPLQFIHNILERM